jgi:hypothetical protein
MSTLAEQIFSGTLAQDLLLLRASETKVRQRQRVDKSGFGCAPAIMRFSLLDPSLCSGNTRDRPSADFAAEGDESQHGE